MVKMYWVSLVYHTSILELLSLEVRHPAIAQSRGILSPALEPKTLMLGDRAGLPALVGCQSPNWIEAISLLVGSSFDTFASGNVIKKI